MGEQGEVRTALTFRHLLLFQRQETTSCGSNYFYSCLCPFLNLLHHVSHFSDKDGGKLAANFAKSPNEFATAGAGKKSHKSATINAMSPRASPRDKENFASPNVKDNGSDFGRKKSVKDIKNVFNVGDEKSQQSKEELEKQVKEAVLKANEAAEKEAARVEEARAHTAEENRNLAKDTIAILEKQMAEMQETIEKLKAQVMA